MKKLNICHVINLDTIGGVEQLFSHFINESQKYEAFHYVLVTGNKVHPKLSSYLISLESLTYEKYLMGIKIPKAFSFLRKMQKRKLLKKQEFDRVILWNRFDDVEVIRKKVGPNCRIIYYEHGASWIKSDQTFDNNFFSHIDQIFVNSYAAKRMCELRWNIKKPIVLIENPLRPDIAILDKERSSINQNPKIGFIGRLIPLKGASLLFHAFEILVKKNKNLKLLVGGVGQEMVQLKNLAEELSIKDNVQFLGVISNIASFYDTIDVLVIPSIREPLGLVALEAQARGCPVIATCIDGLSEAISDGKSGFCISPTLPIKNYIKLGGSEKGLPDLVFDPKTDSLTEPKLVDPNHLADAIDKLLSDKTEYINMSKEALLFTSKWQNFDGYVEKLYHHILT